jgi:peptide/nickel transport system substrate-binding protein
MTLKLNKNYFRTDYGHFDSCEVLTIADVAARTNALTTNEVDAIDRLDIKTMHLLKRNKNISIKETSGTAHYTFAMRTDTAPFDNNDVRLALKYALDREALLQNVLRGHGVVGNDHPIGLSNRYHATTEELPQRVYDPDKAKFHLKKAGLSTLKVDLSAADAAFAGAVDAAVLYKEHAAKAGVEVNPVREPNDGYWSNVWMKKPWSAVYWGGRPTEDWMFSTAYAEGANWNDSFWSHERFNKLLVQARSELDDAKRREMYVEMQRIVSNEGGVVVPMFNNYVFATSGKVGHNEMGANWGMDGNRALERWWFKG